MDELKKVSLVLIMFIVLLFACGTLVWAKIRTDPVQSHGFTPQVVQPTAGPPSIDPDFHFGK